MIEIRQSVYDAWNGTLEATVIDFIAALAAHAGTVDEPRPVAVPLVELIASAGGFSAVTIVPDAVAAAPPGMSLAQAKAWAIGVINAGAEASRATQITPGDGQAMTYLQKRDEAAAYIAAGRPADPAPGTYLMLRAEVDAASEAGDSETLSSVADEVMAQAADWRVTGASIEKARRKATRLINKAATVEAAVALAVWTWPGEGG